MIEKTLFSLGNLKIPATTAIFNLGPATDCPSKKLGFCQLANTTRCYALKAERLYPQVIPYRKRQHKYWIESSAKEFTLNLLQLKKYKKITHLRFNEACDFFEQSCVDKAEKIAVELLNYDIITYCYTARKDLNFSKCTALTVNGSGFMVHNNFLVSSKKGVYNCKMNCRNCSLCIKQYGITIHVTIH